MLFNKLKTYKSEFGRYLIFVSGKFVPGIVSLILIPIISKKYGEDVYGVYSTVYSSFLILITFSSGWLTQGVIMFFSSITNKSAFELSIIFKSFILTILVIPLLYLICDFFGLGSFVLFLLILTMFFCLMFTVQSSILQSKEKVMNLALADTFRSLIYFMVIMVFIFYTENRSYNSLFFALLVSFIIGYLFTIKFEVFSFTKKIFSNKILIFSKDDFKIWKFGWPLTLWLVFAGLLNISDRYMISYFLELEDLSLYSIVYDFIYKIYVFLFSPVIMVIYPIIVKLHLSNKITKLLKLWKTSMFFELIVYLISLLFIYCFRDQIFLDILGLSNIQECYKLILPISLGSFLWQVSIIAHKLLEIKQMTKKMLKFVLFALVFNIIINLIFIPMFGVLASAYSTMFSSLLYLALVYFETKKQFINR
jgi:O-antigen/teichoic acid export membrane protein